MNRFTKMLPPHGGRLLIVLPALLLLAVLFFTPGLVPVTHAASAHAQVPAQPATDTRDCTNLGVNIISDNLYVGNTKVGELDVYYNSSTGFNCAYLNASGPRYGESQRMQLVLFACAETTPGNTCTRTWMDIDQGNYSYYAGPVGVPARGHCIEAMGELVWNGVEPQIWTDPSASHCG